MAPKLAPTVKLNNGYEMPILGLGTYLSTAGDCEQSVKMAIDAGYRHIDTAFFYQNEKEVGAAVRSKIAEGVVKREELFIVTKLFNSFHDPEYVEATCRLQNENLGLGYIDLYLMHTPVGHVYKGFDEPMIPFAQNPKIDFSDTDYVDTYKAMEKCVKLGLIRSIGVSNFNSEQISRVLKVAEIKPVTNQVECSPNLNQKKLTAFCKSHGMVLTAYSPLGKPHMYAVDKNLPKPAFQDPRVQVIGDKYGKTPGQIVLRYLVEIGTLPIPKSVTKERIIQNIDIFDFKLTADEHKLLDSFNTNSRVVTFDAAKNHRYYPFNIEF